MAGVPASRAWHAGLLACLLALAGALLLPGAGLGAPGDAFVGPDDPAATAPPAPDAADMAARAAQLEAAVRIRGGRPTAQGEYPFAVYLEIASGGAIRGSCTGSLIGARWVLTAAHCVTDIRAPGSPLHPAVSVSALIGSADRVALAPGARVLQSTDVFKNASFAVDRNGLRNDLALVRLPEAVPQRAVSLLGPASAALAAPGTVATTMGWGLLGSTSAPPAQVLHANDAPILSDPQCAAADPFAAFDAALMLCAGSVPPEPEAGGTCPGDSGGPLVVPGPGGVLRQAGIVSWGVDPTCQTGPDYHTRVSAYADAIVGFAGGDVAAPVAAPAVQQVSLSPLGPGAVRVAALIDAGQLATEYTIEYGPTPELGSVLSGYAGAGGRRLVVAALRGLDPDTPYHVRVSLANAAGGSSAPAGVLRTLPASS